MNRRFGLVLVVTIGLVAAACSSSAETTTTGGFDAPTTTLAAATFETTAPPVRYRLSLTVSDVEEIGDAATAAYNGEFSIAYALLADLGADEGLVLSDVPGTVEWSLRCEQGGDGAPVRGQSVLAVPDSVTGLDPSMTEAFPDGSWLTPPAISIHDLDGNLWIVHRLPGSVLLGDPVDCPGEPGPLTGLVPSAGAGAMTVRSVNVGGAPLTPADVRNLEVGSFPTTYFTESIAGFADGTGWVVAIVRPESLVAGAVTIDFRDQREGSERSHDIRVTGLIEIID